MKLIHALVHGGLFLSGSTIGWVLDRWIGGSAGYFPLLLGLAFALGLAWPFYCLLGLMPPPPACPKCSARAYVQLQETGKLNHWRCSKCGQIIALTSKTTAVSMNADGSSGKEMILCWPKVFGRWK